MSVTVLTKDVGEVKDVYRRECESVTTDEDRIENSIKFNLGVKNE